MQSVLLRVPATTANLGPGYDCLGMALELWNEFTFYQEGEGIRVTLAGRSAPYLPRDERNLVARAALRLYRWAGLNPPGLSIRCVNYIPFGSGLGSSAAAVVGGLVGANVLLGSPASPEDLLALATEMEGHPDNAAAALVGGLTLSAITDRQIVSRRLDVPPLWVALAVPRVDLPTHAARAALPAQIAHRDAVFNLSRTALVIQALTTGDLALLGAVMEDRLHQPYRLKLIPGAETAWAAGLKEGAAAVALSGAGPSLIAFARREEDREIIADAMVAAFRQAGVAAEGLCLGVSPQGVRVE